MSPEVAALLHDKDAMDEHDRAIVQALADNYDFLRGEYADLRVELKDMADRLAAAEAKVEAFRPVVESVANPYSFDPPTFMPAAAKFAARKALEEEGKSTLTETLGCGCTVTRGWRCPVHGQP